MTIACCRVFRPCPWSETEDRENRKLNKNGKNSNPENPSSDCHADLLSSKLIAELTLFQRKGAGQSHNQERGRRVNCKLLYFPSINLFSLNNFNAHPHYQSGHMLKGFWIFSHKHWWLKRKSKCMKLLFISYQPNNNSHQMVHEIWGPRT